MKLGAIGIKIRQIEEILVDLITTIY